MIVWRCLTALSIAIILVSSILLIKLKLLRRKTEIKLVKDIAVDNKKYNNNDAIIYQSNCKDVKQYMIYKKRKKKYALLNYTNNSKHDLILYCYQDEDGSKFYQKKIRDTGSSHSKLIKLNKDTKYVNIYVNELSSKGSIPSKNILIYSLLSSLILMSVLLLVRSLTLEIISNMYIVYSNKLTFAVSVSLVFIIPIVYFLGLLIVLQNKNKKLKEVNK